MTSTSMRERSCHDIARIRRCVSFDASVLLALRVLRFCPSRTRYQSQSCSSRTLIQQLNWLAVKYRIDFRIAKVTFRTLHSSQSAYLRSSLLACHSTRSLRLSNTNLLSASFVCTSFGARSSALQPLKS